MSPWTLIAPVVAGGVSAWGTFHPRSQLFGPIVRTAGSACALTFDDGPNPRVTPRLLSLLEKHRVRATFFVLGKYVRENPGLAAEIAAANHAIANHTYAHPSLVLFSRKRIVDELRRCDDTVFEATGKRTVLVRPPFGFRGPQFRSASHQAGYTRVVMWSINGRDWSPQPAQNVAQRLRKAGIGDIILLHDGDHRTSNADRSHMLAALETCLPQWLDVGLKFAKL